HSPLFFLSCFPHLLHSHSFPTRRSSDLDLQSFFDLSSLINATDRQPLISRVPSVGSSPTFRERLRGAWQVPSYRSLLSARRLAEDRKSTRLNSSHEWISYAVFCLKKKKH